MSGVEVRIAPRAGEVIVGASLTVEVTLRNPGGSLVEVHGAGSESALEYEFVSTDGRASMRKVSVRRYKFETNLQPEPPKVPERQALRPGDEARYTEDVAASFVTPLPPGDYDLVAHYHSLGGVVYASEPARVRVVPPRAVLTAETVSHDGLRIATVFVHHDGPGAHSVYQRESERLAPGRGVAYERHRADVGARIDGLAVATETELATRWRWVAWLEGSSFRAAIGWGATLVHSMVPSEHGLDGAFLLGSGWQSSKGAGLFVLAGTQGGTAVLSLVTLPDRVAPRYQTFDLGPALPCALVAGCRNGDGQALEVVRADVVNDLTWITAERIDPDRPMPRSPTRSLFAHGGTLRALAMAPLLSGDADYVDALFGPVVSDVGLPVMVYVRAPLSGEAASFWTFSPPDAPAAVDSWAICQTPHPRAPVVARAGDQLWILDAAAQTAWSLVAKSSRPAEHPRVLSLAPAAGRRDGRVIVTWLDVDAGFSYQERTLEPDVP